MRTPSSLAALRGVALISLAATSWGTTGSVTTLLVRDAGASPLVIGEVRLILASVVLLAGARLLGPLRAERGGLWRMAAMGACMAVFQAAYFTAVLLTGIAVAALIAICSAPLMIAALAAGFLGERLSWRGGLALSLGVGGTALLIAGPETAGAARGFGAGAVLALTAGLAYALYVVIAKATLARAAPLPLAALTFTAAALWSLPVLLVADGLGRQVALGWPWLLYLGVVATAGAYAAHTAGLREVPAGAAGIVGLLEPLTATLLGVLVFGERLGAAGAAGAALLFAALALLVTDSAGRRGAG